MPAWPSTTPAVTARSAEALSAADVARGRLTLLADASRILASSLDVDTTLKHIATLTVPRLADICVIDLVNEAGEIRRVVIETGPGARTRHLRDRRAPAVPCEQDGIPSCASSTSRDRC